MENFLLVDTSTQVTQCATVSSDGKIVNAMRGRGDVVEILPRLVGEICKSGFADKAGIVYCHGPGSTLGLRSAIMAINVWIRFCGKNLKLFRYSSLSMARYLAKGGVVTCGSSGKFIAEMASGEVRIIGSLDGFENFYFLNTRRIIPAAASVMRSVDYDLGKFGGNVFEIADGVEIPDLFETGERVFSKWSGERHRGNN